MLVEHGVDGDDSSRGLWEMTRGMRAPRAWAGRMLART